MLHSNSLLLICFNHISCKYTLALQLLCLNIIVVFAVKKVGIEAKNKLALLICRKNEWFLECNLTCYCPAIFLVKILTMCVIRGLEIILVFAINQVLIEAFN